MKSRNLIVFLTSFSLFQWLPHNNVKKLIFLSLTMCTIGEAHTNQNYITRQHLRQHGLNRILHFADKSCTSREAVNPLDSLVEHSSQKILIYSTIVQVEPSLNCRIFDRPTHTLPNLNAMQCNVWRHPLCLWYIQIEPCVTSDFSVLLYIKERAHFATKRNFVKKVPKEYKT
jgi:hypothetical protein